MLIIFGFDFNDLLKITSVIPKREEEDCIFLKIVFQRIVKTKSAGKVSRFSLLIECSERNLSCYFEIVKPRKKDLNKSMNYLI